MLKVLIKIIQKKPAQLSIRQKTLQDVPNALLKVDIVFGDEEAASSLDKKNAHTISYCRF